MRKTGPTGSRGHCEIQYVRCQAPSARSVDQPASNASGPERAVDVRAAERVVGEPQRVGVVRRAQRPTIVTSSRLKQSEQRAELGDEDLAGLLVAGAATPRRSRAARAQARRSSTWTASRTSCSWITRVAESSSSR